MSSSSDGAVAGRRLTERELAKALDRADRFEFARRDQVYRHLARVAAETLGYQFAAEPVEPSDAEIVRRARAAEAELADWMMESNLTPMDMCHRLLAILRSEVTP